MPISKYVILGGGMVAGYAAREMIERGLPSGQLTILSAEDAVPYERPPLSKGFLAAQDTAESIRINPPEFYARHGIELKLSCQAAGVDASRRLVRLQSGEDHGFDKLLIATGARARRLDIPGCELSGVCYLRSLQDARRLRAQAAAAKQALVIGGGFIGMEVASVLARKGVATTMLLREDRIWKPFFTPAMSRFFEEYYGARGVAFLKQAALAELRGAGAVSSARLQSGQTIGCDLVVAGIGALPVTELLDGSGIPLHNGVIVNEYLETSQPGIYAAGDIANYPDTLYGKRRRVEHWDNAVSQGQHGARTLLGDRQPFVHVPYFFSDVFDLSYEFWGDPAGADEIVERGDLAGPSFSVWWLQQQRLVAAFVMHRPDEERDAAQRWIAAGQRLAPARLKASASLEDALA
jgi:3-phenylpropionate/trans-cinnamate dioxygenase ferredoxin reductase component